MSETQESDSVLFDGAVSRWTPCIIRSAFITTVVYIPCLLIVCIIVEQYQTVPTFVVAVFVVLHAVVILQNLTALLMTSRDWQRRLFVSKKSKYLWLLAITMTGGVGWIWYVVRFRLHQSHSSESISNQYI